jgi:hypothetical protein
MGGKGPQTIMTDKPAPGTGPAKSRQTLERLRDRLFREETLDWRPRTEEVVSVEDIRAIKKPIINGELWVNLLGFVILQLAIAVGWIAATGGHVGDNWKSVLIAFAAAALGFGAANLLSRHFDNVRVRKLESDYKMLKARSGVLQAKLDRFENADS